MVGPGLFLALLTVSLRAMAETPVGLAAQGVDPRVAVENAWGLDVRDEQGRPVTREQVQADLKAVSVKRAGENAFTSALPKAKAVFAALELLAEAAAAWRLAGELFRIPDLTAALPGGKPKLAVLYCALLGLAAATVVYRCRASSRLAFVRSPQSSIEVLRC